MSREPIGVIGVGYVGLVTAACFAVAAATRSSAATSTRPRSRRCSAARCRSTSPGLDDLMAEHRDAAELHARPRARCSSAPALAFVCVDTPPTVSGDADLSRVQRGHRRHPADAPRARAGDEVDRARSAPASACAPSSTRAASRSVGYVSNPEFLREGTAIARLHARPTGSSSARIAEEDAERVAALYDGFECPILRTDVPSAEMVKLASNAFLATKISFINEIANVCEEVGADVAEVAHGMGLDPPHRREVPAAGGRLSAANCFPKDVRR